MSVPTHSGSALGLSQPLNGFLAGTSSTGLFHPATVRRLSPSEVSPRKNRAPLSRPPAPLRLSTNLRDVSLACLHSAFTDSHARKRSCLDPHRSYDSLSASLGHRPVSRSSLSPRATEPSVPSASPASKPYSSHESVHANPSCPVLTADPLLTFCPSRVFPSRPWAPQTRPDTRPELAPWPEDQDPRHQRTSSPQRRVRPPRLAASSASSAVPSFLQLDRTASRRHDLPSQPWGTRRSGPTPALRASQWKRSRRFSAENVPSHGVSCLLADLVTSRTSTTRAY